MIRLALIGVGGWGKNIISTLEKIPGANLKYLCADKPEYLAEFPAKYEKTTNWRDLLDKKDIDGILIATPPITHFEMASAFLNKKIPVFVEKPMVTTVSDAEKLRALAEKNGKILMVGYQYIYNDYVWFIKNQIEKGIFGKIIKIKSEHVLSPSRVDVSVFWDAAPHPLSIFQYIFAPKKLLSAKGKIEHDKAVVSVQFENAPILEIFESSFGEKKIRKTTIVGEKAVCVLDETMEKNKLAVTQNEKTSYPEISAKPSLQNEMEHFLQCLKTGETPRSNVDFGCQITEWLEFISKQLS